MTSDYGIPDVPREPEQATWLQVIRWIGTVPAAVVGSVLAYWIGRLIMWLGSSRFGDETWFEFFFKEIFSSGLMGAAFVYCAAFLAPKFKRQTAVTFAGILLCLSAALFYAAIMTSLYMSMLSIVCMNVGSIITAVATYNEEIDFHW